MLPNIASWKMICAFCCTVLQRPVEASKMSRQLAGEGRSNDFAKFPNVCAFLQCWSTFVQFQCTFPQLLVPHFVQDCTSVAHLSAGRKDCRAKFLQSRWCSAAAVAHQLQASLHAVIWCYCVQVCCLQAGNFTPCAISCNSGARDCNCTTSAIKCKPGVQNCATEDSASTSRTSQAHPAWVALFAGRDAVGAILKHSGAILMKVKLLKCKSWDLCALSWLINCIMTCTAVHDYCKTWKLLTPNHLGPARLGCTSLCYISLFSGNIDDNLVGQLTACRVAPIKDKSCNKVSRQGAPPSVHVAFFQTMGLQEHQKNKI